MDEIKIYTKKEKELYIYYLLQKFGSVTNAINVIDELIKICPLGSKLSDLKEVRKIIKILD